MLKSLYKKIVLAITSFLGGASGAFLLSGAGSPGLNIMMGLIFLVSFLNMSLYINEYYKNFKTRMASFRPPPPPPPKPASGDPGGGPGSGPGPGSGGAKS